MPLRGKLFKEYILNYTNQNSTVNKIMNSEISDLLMNFEMGELDSQGTLRLFSELIRTGALSHLQGYYQRTAMDLVDAGYLANNGDILA
jgi:hypothetical protein